ncbi:MAG: DNA polymerase III subunit chi [Alphaproteobacteria bacterium]|nr:MAG: DNA polymerase III subunit chi [Alphaproteobacteria bacterium]
MLAEVRFYHLERQPLEAALPRLLERVHERGLSAVVKLPDVDRVERIDRVLWTYDPDSFLPHGTAAGPHPDRQPIYLTAGDERPNGASILVLADAAPEPPALDAYERCLYMFDGQDERIVEAARAAWRRFASLAGTRSYWQQKPTGGWEQKL